ncbi:MAG: HDOD domain-containing protein [Rhodocyclales bacterium]|nr:HDOD domain-containing protein [Rhodocyclales bacterium]
MSLLDKPLNAADAYVSFLAHQDMPVLRQTAKQLASLRESADSVNAKRLAAVVLGDPLMTMKLIAHLQAVRHSSQNHDITTIDRAIMMLGVSPFFDAFSDAPTLEGMLGSHPAALIGALQVIARARKAAHLARDWAIARHDLDVDEITVAALLGEAPELMCWTFAPALMTRVKRLQAADRNLRSSVAFRAVFGVGKVDLQIGLINAWNMPVLLMTLLDASHAENPRVRNVRLANNFARHLANGWDDPALPDDIDEIERLLHIGREQLLLRLGTPAEHAHRFNPADE